MVVNEKESGKNLKNISTKTVLSILLCGFIIFCGYLVVESGVFDRIGGDGGETFVVLASTTESQAAGDIDIEAYGEDEFDLSKLTATSTAEKRVSIGSVDKDSGFKFVLELTNHGAAVARATLSEFDDRDYKNPQPLNLLKPIEIGSGKEIYSLANGNFELVAQKHRFPLDKLNWFIGDVITDSKGGQEVSFEAVLKDAAGRDTIKITKTFRVIKDSYDVGCELTVANLCDRKLEAGFNLQGPGGIGREDVRVDSRAVVAAFITPEGKIESTKIDNLKLRKAKKVGEKEQMQLQQKYAGTPFLWAALTNKYFTTILRPVPDENKSWVENVKVGSGQYYDAGLADKKPDGDENIALGLKVHGVELSALGSASSIQEFRFSVYLGPKDRSLFEENELYRDLGYFHTIDFRSCFCCPASIIRPLAFGVMGLMKTMYTLMGPFGNYGVVIMVLVFLVRLVMHPVTKKSQISMMKMQKLGPMMEEIKQKYANNKSEMNKKVMGLYKEQGVSPFSSMLPMMLQMPIWIALWTAVNASIDLRGAAFLPFWITDLSAPDAVFYFKELTIPLLGWHIDSFNLLPILMGVVMYLQQKLMPHSASSAQTNPQMAQQQKMMMIMMPLMFPIMLYKGPAGVNLYIMSSISAGVIEQIIIRKHLREKEAEQGGGLVAVTSKTGGKVKKKKPKPFFKNTL